MKDMKEMKEMKEFSAVGRKNMQHMETQTLIITRQIRVFSEIAEVQMFSNEHASERFGSYMNAMNALKRK